jgi:hypothetical protein
MRRAASGSAINVSYFGTFRLDSIALSSIAWSC